MNDEQASAWISAARLEPFLEATGDFGSAVRLYEWHAGLAAAAFQLVHHFEVLLRNAIDAALGKGQPQEPLRDTWLMDFNTLQPGGIKQVIVAVERLERGKAVTRGRVVAGVSFGFWAGLFGGQYEELWRKRMRYAFPFGSGDRKQLPEPLKRIQRFRNRVAHHDCLLAQDPRARQGDMLLIAGWIDPMAREWLEGRSNVEAVLAARP
jgi:hypothetical protein